MIVIDLLNFFKSLDTEKNVNITNIKKENDLFSFSYARNDDHPSRKRNLFIKELSCPEKILKISKSFNNAYKLLYIFCLSVKETSNEKSQTSFICYFKFSNGYGIEININTDTGRIIVDLTSKNFREFVYFIEDKELDLSNQKQIISNIINIFLEFIDFVASNPENKNRLKFITTFHKQIQKDISGSIESINNLFNTDFSEYQ